MRHLQEHPCHAICDRKCSAFDGMGDCERKRSISIWGKVKAYLRRGAKKVPGFDEYPNEEVGYGALCTAQSIPQI